ncbi:MAG: PH domain-containing protein [Mycobacterium sp.]
MTEGQWDAEFRPRVVPRAAYVLAALIALTGIVVAILNNRTSGAILRVADQIAMAGLAFALAGVIAFVLGRPRLRVGRAGLSVRNVFDDRLIPWPEVVDFTFPPGKRWARVDLQAYEYVPVLAIQLADRQRAVEAMETVRALMARYRPDLD